MAGSTRAVCATVSCVLALLACSSCASVRAARSKERTSASPSAHPPEPIAPAQAEFAGLTITRPAAWRRFTPLVSDDLYPDASGYLTNAPVSPGCLAHARPGYVVCGQPAAALQAGQVYVIVQVLYQQRATGLVDNGRLATYAADIDSAADPSTSGCPAGTARAVTVDAWSDTVQPSEVWIFGCFGANSSAELAEFTTMLKSASIASRPPATVRVPDAPACTSAAMKVSTGPLLSPAGQEEGLTYAVENIGSRLCSIAGYPTVRLEAGTRPLPFAYVHGGPFIFEHQRMLYLRPGMYATFEIYTHTCESSPGVTHATRAAIRLPGEQRATTLPATNRRGGTSIAYCAVAEPGDNVVHVGPLVGY